MTETATGGRIVPLRHPRLVRGSHRPFGRARGEPLQGGAPRSAQPPETAYSGGGTKISLSPAASCASIRRPSPSSSLVRFRAKMYPTGIPSSYLGTISPDFVLNWILKFVLGNKKPRFCTQPESQRHPSDVIFPIVRSFCQIAAHLSVFYATLWQVSVQL